MLLLARSLQREFYSEEHRDEGPLLESCWGSLTSFTPIFVALRPCNSMEYSDPQTMNYGTLPARLLTVIDKLPNPRAQMIRRDGHWEPISSQEFLRRVAGLSTAFVELGVKPGDRVGLFSANRPEWHTADFAVTGAGGVTVPVYFHESPDRMTYILKHCGAKVVFVAGTAQLQKLLAARKELPELEQIIVADAGSDVPTECLRYETLIAGASAADVSSYRLRVSHVLTGQLASLIYTLLSPTSNLWMPLPRLSWRFVPRLPLASRASSKKSTRAWSNRAPGTRA